MTCIVPCGFSSGYTSSFGSSQPDTNIPGLTFALRNCSNWSTESSESLPLIFLGISTMTSDYLVLFAPQTMLHKYTRFTVGVLNICFVNDSAVLSYRVDCSIERIHFLSVVSGTRQKQKQIECRQCFGIASHTCFCTFESIFRKLIM